MKTLRDFWAWIQQPLNLAASLAALAPMYWVYIYMETYGRNVPVNDHWLFGMDIAIAAQNGTLSLDLILRDFAGHRIFFTGALHALMSYLTQWNTVYEMYLNLPLAVGEFLMLVAIFRRQAPQWTAAVLIPFSLLTFSVYQYLNWLNGFYSIWHFVPLFFLLTLWVVQTPSPNPSSEYSEGKSDGGRRWLAILGAIFFSICATFSLGPGVVTWAAILIGMALFGYRDWRHYAAYLLALAGTLYFYTREVSVSVGDQSGGFSTLRFPPLDEGLTFFFTFLGNPFTSEYNHLIASRLALAGVLIFALNLLYLWWREGKLSAIAPWATMALFAGGVALLITITRYVEFRWITALEHRYTVISTQFWLAWVATAVLIMGGGNQKQWRGHGPLVIANVILGMALLGLYGRANIWNWQATATRYGEKIDLPYPQYNEEDCILDYPLRRHEACIKQTFVVQLGNAQPEQIYQLAAYRLTIFATQTPANILPGQHQAGDPLIINSHSRWLNVYIRDWLFDGAPENLMYHLAPPELPADSTGRPLPQTADLPNPLVQLTEPEDWRPLLEGMMDKERLWYLYTPEVASQAVEIKNYLSEQGYVGLYIPIRQTPYDQGHFNFILYRRAPEDAEIRFRFDELLSLRAWDLPESARPCESLQITTWWQLESPAPNLSLTLRLLNAGGEKVSNTDGAPAGIDLGVWEPDKLYADDRALSLPCDLPPGDYQLVAGFYRPEDFGPIMAYDAAGEALGDYAPLGTIRVDN